MRKFILKILIFFAICAALDGFMGYASSILQQNSKGGLTQKDEYIKNKMDADVVIMGSSRAGHHYVSNIIADSLNCTVYNAGMDAQGIVFNYGLYLQIIKRYNPKVIIYELFPPVDWEQGDNEKYLTHLRHAYNIRGVDSIFWDVNPSERIKMISNSYRVNSLVPHLIYDNIFAKTDTLNGYVPFWNVFKHKDSEKESDDLLEAHREVDTLKVKYLQRVIKDCKERNIYLIFAMSPLLKYSDDQFIFGENLARNYDIDMIDFREMKQSFNDEALYQDISHLNNDGATLYTKQVCKLLSSWLPQ